MTSPLQLKETTPLAQGHSRLIFQHPHEPAWLVKVIRPDMIEKRFGSGVAWYKRRRRYGRYLSYVRESQEFIAAWASHGESLSFMQKVIGFAETDLGLGLVLEAARGRDGGLAPHIAEVIETGRFDSTVRTNLELFLEQLASCDVIVSDLNVGNLVYAHDERHGDHFVLIDGMGNSNILPFKAMSRWVNLRSKRGKFRRLFSRIETRLAAAGHPMPPLPANAPRP